MFNQGMVWIHKHITELLTAFIGKNTTYTRKNTDSKIMDVANWNTCKTRSLAVEYVILMRYNY